MQPIEFYLDEILKLLNKDRDLPVANRSNLNPDFIIREVFKTHSDRYEDFYEVMEILETDGFIKRLNDNLHIAMIDKYRDCLITMKGSLFIGHDGYTQKFNDEKNDRVLKDSRDKRLSNGTVWLAVGTFLIVAWELVKTFVFEHHYWCDF